MRSVSQLISAIAADLVVAFCGACVLSSIGLAGAAAFLFHLSIYGLGLHLALAALAMLGVTHLIQVGLAWRHRKKHRNI